MPSMLPDIFFQGIEDLKAIEWSRGYAWDLRFPEFSPGQGIPNMHNWFPAVDVEEGLFTINAQEWQMGLGTIKMPLNTAAQEIRITFIERGDHAISKWLVAWYNSIIRNVNGTQFIGYLDEILRPLQIMKLTADRKPLSIKDYRVFPEGQLVFHGSSESAAEMITQNFIVCGS